MQNELHFYKVAGHVFAVSARCELLSQMQNYAPFAVNPLNRSTGEPVFTLTVHENGGIPAYTEDTRQADGEQSIICGKTQDGASVFDFCTREISSGILACSRNFKQNNLHLKKDLDAYPYAINNALMVLYSIATANLGTALFHASAIQNGNRAYLFLGKSGTGKSTHARLWLKHNEGLTLLNDDNPVVRIFKNGDGGTFAKVYGSPWSGKTPCYKNEEAEVGGFVLLSQAPFNKVSPLKGVAAYAALLPCISGMRWNKEIADALHRTENELATSIPVWHLECLPDEAAARLCKETIA